MMSDADCIIRQTTNKQINLKFYVHLSETTPHVNKMDTRKLKSTSIQPLQLKQHC
jgi:hypothetical protein